MSKSTITLLLFGLFAIGLPLYGMQNNPYTSDDNHRCAGDCYTSWVAQTGGVLAMEAAASQARAEASPEMLGKQAYVGCVACHGANGEGGIGPMLAGQTATEISSKLIQYKAGETRGKQSSLMWSQAGLLSDQEIDHIGAFIETL